MSQRIFSPFIIYFFLPFCCMAQPKIALQSGSIALPANESEFFQKTNIQPGELVNGHYYRILQFDQIPNAALRKKMQTAGVELLEYIPSKAYRAAISISASLSDLKDCSIRSAVPVNPDWKINRNLLQPPYGDWAQHGDQLEILLSYYPNLPEDLVLHCLEQQNIKLIRKLANQPALLVQIPISNIRSLAALPFVSSLELKPIGYPEDTGGSTLHRDNQINSDIPGGLHFTGEGIPVLIRDDGQIGPHIDFKNRVEQSTATAADAFNFHGDGVAGILAGAGNLNPVMKGMAEGAFLFVIDYDEFLDDTTLSLLQENSQLITSTSYSNGCNDGYTENARITDQQIYEHPNLMHVFSAGNSNGIDCGYGAGTQWGNITGGHKMGKNCIATANLTADAQLVASSSRGPANDGRIKPDISANGDGQYSTDFNNQYQEFGGTSAAAPGISGTLALLSEAFSQFNAGSVAPSALLKACLLNTTNDLGNAGPDFKYGWGLVNGFRAFKTIQEHRYLDGQIDQSGLNQHTISLPPGLKQLRIMVYWADKESSLLSAKALVNNLDMEVVDPTGNSNLPWLLDPTPDPLILNLPAGHGVDDLNNVEQVLINNPAPGDYTIRISGTEIPFGPQQYYVVYEEISEPLTLTYPIGGEGIVPGVPERIHWDATGTTEDFTVELSTNNGASWSLIGAAQASNRLIDWQVPNVVSGQARIRVTSGAYTDESDAPFSIIGIPQNIEVTASCPQSISITWNTVPGAVGYEVFVLGEKYMDSVGVTTLNQFDIPVTNPTQETWFAVSALSASGMKGRRSDAQHFSGGLQNCILNNNLSLLQLNSPASSPLYSCSEYHEAPKVLIKNTGLSTISSFWVSYQLDNEPVVSDQIQSAAFPAGSEYNYQFLEPLVLTNSGYHQLRVWTTFSPDEYTYDDTIVFPFEAIIAPSGGAALDYVETFESPEFPPASWLLENSDNFITWNVNTVTGIDGALTRAAYMYNFGYNAIGQEDALVSVPIHLIAGNTPFLSFDVAYATYNESSPDGLRVEVYTDCGQQLADIIYNKMGAELATVLNQSDEWHPTAASHWRHETIDLQAFAGNSIVLKFVNNCFYGNDLYLDNIQVYDAGLSSPHAAFTVSADAICVGESIVFSDASTGGNLTYNWNFGAGAIPASAGTAGPHTVQYSVAGNTTATLSVSNALGVHMDNQNIAVKSPPLPQFTYSIHQDTVAFANATQFAGSYLWSFGDGSSSQETNPIHVFSGDSTYLVTLTAVNDCGDASYTDTVQIGISTSFDIYSEFEAGIHPNPNDGSFSLSIRMHAPLELSGEIFDVAGRPLSTFELPATSGNFEKIFSMNFLPPGVYFIRLRGNEYTQTLHFLKH